MRRAELKLSILPILVVGLDPIGQPYELLICSYASFCSSFEFPYSFRSSETLVARFTSTHASSTTLGAWVDVQDGTSYPMTAVLVLQRVGSILPNMSASHASRLVDGMKKGSTLPSSLAAFVTYKMVISRHNVSPRSSL